MQAQGAERGVEACKSNGGWFGAEKKGVVTLEAIALVYFRKSTRS